MSPVACVPVIFITTRIYGIPIFRAVSVVVFNIIIYIIIIIIITVVVVCIHIAFFSIKIYIVGVGKGCDGGVDGGCGGGLELGHEGSLLGRRRAACSLLGIISVIFKR